LLAHSTRAVFRHYTSIYKQSAGIVLACYVA